MKAYVVTSGTVFALIVLAHLWRVIVEGTGVARDPWFLGFTALAAGFSAWAFAALRRS